MPKKYIPTGNPMGRPLKEINQKQFEALCNIQCTEDEICAVLDVDDKTLCDWCERTYGGTFSDTYKEMKLNGKSSLRRTQWLLGQKNVTMAIWLGKQYLGQSDNVEVAGADNKPLQIKFVGSSKDDQDKRLERLQNDIKIENE